MKYKTKSTFFSLMVTLIVIIILIGLFIGLLKTYNGENNFFDNIFSSDTTTGDISFNGGEYISGNNLTLYGKYVEDYLGTDYYGFTVNQLRPNTNYRFRLNYYQRDENILVGVFSDDKINVLYNSTSGYGVYDDNTRECMVDCVVRSDANGCISIICIAPQIDVSGSSDLQSYADSYVSGYSVSFSQTEVAASSFISTVILVDPATTSEPQPEG